MISIAGPTLQMVRRGVGRADHGYVLSDRMVSSPSKLRRTTSSCECRTRASQFIIPHQAESLGFDS